jgi:sulfur relay protein TusB/DsrH
VSCLFICHQLLPESECHKLFELISAGDGLLLIEDATYLVQSPLFSTLQHRYVLKTDLLIRGITNLNHDFKLIDNYTDMVELTLAFDKSLTWSLKL